MGLLPDTQNCALRMRRECRERFPRRWLQRKPIVSYPGLHHGTCVTHMPWCMSGSLTRGGGENSSRHSQRMRNPQFYVSGKRPKVVIWTSWSHAVAWDWYPVIRKPVIIVSSVLNSQTLALWSDNSLVILRIREIINIDRNFGKKVLRSCGWLIGTWISYLAGFFVMIANVPINLSSISNFPTLCKLRLVCWRLSIMDMNESDITFSLY